MIAPDLSPDLLARLVDRIVYDRVCMAVGPDALPELEEDLIAALDAIRRPGDPPAKPVAVHLIVAAIHRIEGEIADARRRHVAGGAS